MTQWRRRNRNTYSRTDRADIRSSMGRRYADALPEAVNKAFDAIVVHHEAKEYYEKGGGSAYRVNRAWSDVTQAINNLKL